MKGEVKTWSQLAHGFELSVALRTPLLSPDVVTTGAGSTIVYTTHVYVTQRLLCEYGKIMEYSADVQ